MPLIEDRLPAPFPIVLDPPGSVAVDVLPDDTTPERPGPCTGRPTGVNELSPVIVTRPTPSVESVPSACLRLEVNSAPMPEAVTIPVRSVSALTEQVPRPVTVIVARARFRPDTATAPTAPIEIAARPTLRELRVKVPTPVIVMLALGLIV